MNSINPIGRSQTNPLTSASQNTNTTSSRAVTYDENSRRYILNGKSFTLVNLMYYITEQSAIVAKQKLADDTQKMNDANRQGEAALEWTNTLRQNETEGPDDSTTLAYRINQAADHFKNKYGYDPFQKYGLTKKGTSSHTDTSTYTHDEIQKMIDTTKSYSTTISNDQQALQLDIQRDTHVITELEQLSTAVNKAFFDLGSFIVNKYP